MLHVNSLFLQQLKSFLQYSFFKHKAITPGQPTWSPNQLHFHILPKTYSYTSHNRSGYFSTTNIHNRPTATGEECTAIYFNEGRGRELGLFRGTRVRYGGYLNNPKDYLHSGNTYQIIPHTNLLQQLS